MVDVVTARRQRTGRRRARRDAEIRPAHAKTSFMLAARSSRSIPAGSATVAASRPGECVTLTSPTSSLTVSRRALVCELRSFCAFRTMYSLRFIIAWLRRLTVFIGRHSRLPRSIVAQSARIPQDDRGEFGRAGPWPVTGASGNPHGTSGGPGGRNGPATDTSLGSRTHWVGDDFRACRLAPKYKFTGRAAARGLQ